MIFCLQNKGFFFTLSVIGITGVFYCLVFRRNYFDFFQVLRIEQIYFSNSGYLLSFFTINNKGQGRSKRLQQLNSLLICKTH